MYLVINFVTVVYFYIDLALVFIDLLGLNGCLVSVPSYTDWST